MFGVLFFFASPAWGSSKGYTSKQAYIEDWYRTAINQMINHKIPASITLAQGILESSYGNSILAKEANNHFGIKCAEWKGEKIYQDDDEKNECFRKYATAAASYEDHSEFLTKRSRYSFLFDYEITDYKKWAKGLKSAGYATNPKYPSLLIDLIENLELYKYDQMGLTNPGQWETVTKIPDTQEESSSSKKEIKRHSTKLKNRIFTPFTTTNRQLFSQPNKTKYILAKRGDTYVKIAKEFELTLRQLYNYNDFPKGKELLTEGDIIYLQPKRGASSKQKEIVLTKAMSAVEISQQYGVKLSRILRKNDLQTSDETLKKGQRIKL